jgi:lipopolysaccharide export system permease protein
MPILWRYLLKSYFQVFVLCVLAFISVLLVIRFQEIASFASSGASLQHIGLFTLYQIPYILPIAIPISCLISAMILFQKLSHTHELTAFRTCGLGLGPIAYPLVLCGILLSLLNFTIASEVTPHTRSLSKKLIYEITAENPLVLLQKDTMIKLKNSYIDLKTLKSGKSADDVIFITKQSSSDRLGVMTAKGLSVKKDLLLGKYVTLISSIDPKTPGYDHLVIENQKTMQTEASTLIQYLNRSEWSSSDEYSSLRGILAKETIDPSNRTLAISKGAELEISKRITLGLAAFTFTFIGVAFGMDISRHRRKKGVLWAFGLASFFMVSFVAAKSFRHTPHTASLVYLLPHVVIFLFCMRSFRAIARGIE